MAGTGICLSIAALLFARGVISGEVKPHVWAWIVRVLIALVAFVSQAGLGATYSLALSGAQVIIGFVMLGLLFRYVRPLALRPAKLDLAFLAVALGGVALNVSGHYAVTVLGIVFADICATIMGMSAALRSGATESVPFWTFCFIGAIMSVIAAIMGPEKNIFWILLLPLFSCVNALSNIAMVLCIRTKVAKEVKLPAHLVRSKVTS